MAQLFADQLRDASNGAEKAAVWTRAIADTLLDAPRERLTGRRVARVAEGPAITQGRPLAPDLLAAAAPLLLLAVLLLAAPGFLAPLFEERASLLGAPMGITLTVGFALLAGLGVVALRPGGLRDGRTRLLAAAALAVPLPTRPVALLRDRGAVRALVALRPRGHPRDRLQHHARDRLSHVCRTRSATARAFHDADGVGDWRVMFSGAHAYFRARSFEHGTRFVAAIAEVAEAVGHFPDVDLRPEGVTVRTASGEYGALSQRDVELARRIAVEARRLQVEPDPSQVQVVGIAVAQDAGSDVGPFWAAVLGYRSLGADEDVVDRHRRNPHVSFQRLDPPKPGRGRTHIDVSVPADQAAARIAAALGAGGRLADETHAPHWWTLASPENHGVDIAAWPDFEDEDT